jgi:asparagine synthase (glutamine-hydrolysing)
MYGFALHDRGDRSLLLVRDRAGEKPLYYTQVGDEIWFASEIQALLVGGVVRRELDEAALERYLALGYVPEPATLFRGVSKIPAGSAVRFGAGGQEVWRYWRPEEMQGRAAASGDRVAALREALERAVRQQMRADVPVGLFLSGGLDSSLLAAIAASQSPHPLQTFTACFRDKSYDEGDWAAQSAARIGADHHPVVIDDERLVEAFEAVTGLAEPISDPAALPTYLVAKEARRHVTVALSGEGADELFGGYPTYLGHRLAQATRGLRAPLSILHRLLRARPESRDKVPIGYLVARFLEHAEADEISRHQLWFGAGLGTGTLAASTGSGGASPQRALPRSAFPPEMVAALPPGLAKFMLLDYQTYLREGLLPKIDRTTMLNSLEARAPFLDRGVSQFAWGLPLRDRVRGLRGKWILKEAALQWLPRSVVYRRKRGLSVPVARLIDGPLRGEVDRVLARERLEAQGLFAAGPVGRLLAEHRGEQRNHGRGLWALVMFQRWLERWLPERASGTG